MLIFPHPPFLVCGTDGGGSGLLLHASSKGLFWKWKVSTTAHREARDGGIAMWTSSKEKGEVRRGQDRSGLSALPLVVTPRSHCLQGTGKSPSHDLTVASPLLSFPASVVEVAGHAHVLLAAFEKVRAVLATTL